NGKIGGIDEKALYYREPYTSVVGVKSYLPTAISYPEHPEASIQKDEIRDLSSLLQPDGSLEWNVPSGNWTIMRFGVRNNGAITRPAPYPGLGFECDKFDTIAFRNHFNEYVGKLLRKVGTAKNKSGYGWTMLHMDSWEMGSQNWDSDFRMEFQKRRGYDPNPFLPVYSGRVVANTEQSERFLWDLRQTANELVLENHAGYLKKLCQKYGLGLSIEPYDMNPTSDLDLGAVADIPMCEFWSKGYGFNSSFSCIEATSIANLIGSHIVAAESFTSESFEAWKLYPGALKNQGDWAFCAGINRFFYHTFAHKPLGDQYRPGMTMGPYGVHWDRGQTWWPMVTDYHKYIARCSYMLQQGLRVADILYLTPEGAPHVFRAPKSALIGNDTIPDRKGYNFDGCSPRLLMAKASVMNHQITFPGGANYKLLVLPSVETMTPELLAKIESLVKAGAIVVGNPPKKSPSLVNYPECDAQLRNKALQLWGDLSLPVGLASRVYGNGMIYWGQGLCLNDSTALYPDYDLTASILNQKNVSVDFESTGPIRYTHRETSSQDIYFVSNTTSRQISADCIFRSVKGAPELWDPISCKVFKQLKCMAESGRTKIPMQFDAYQSYFVVFDKSNVLTKGKSANVNNLSTINT
ncbi:MAG: glycosyl hydrolase, partial [Bacteroidota bacterium]|nr:glycosyl hydrolase [Bacteroidota bacterium]